MFNTQQTSTIPPRPSLWNPKMAWGLGFLGALGLAAYQAGLGRRRMGFTSRLDINRKSGATGAKPGLKVPRQDGSLRLSWLGALLAVPLSGW
jgi:hypothetical protein